MMACSSFLEFLVVWSDYDLQEILITASNSSFSGKVNLYAGPTEISAFADLIHGFPVGLDDAREFSFGQDGLSGYGTAHVSLTCKDSTGHIWITTTVRREPIEANAPAESATVTIAATVGDIDRFETALRALSGLAEPKATLQGEA
jgi:hypothetical protein